MFYHLPIHFWLTIRILKCGTKFYLDMCDRITPSGRTKLKSMWTQTWAKALDGTYSCIRWLMHVFVLATIISQIIRISSDSLEFVPQALAYQPLSIPVNRRILATQARSEPTETDRWYTKGKLKKNNHMYETRGKGSTVSLVHELLYLWDASCPADC